MANRLVEQARDVGGDELAERVERLLGELEEVKDDLDDEQELRSDLIEEGGFSEEAVDGMDIQAMREIAEHEGIRSRTNVKINVAGHPDMIPDESPVVTNQSQLDTFEREVPVTPVAGRVNLDNPEMRTVECEETGPTIEAIHNYNTWLNEARSESSGRTNNEEKLSGGIPSMEYMNSEDVEIDEENDEIPVAGNPNVEDEE